MENTLYDVRREIIARECDNLHEQGILDEDDSLWLKRNFD